LQLSKKLARWVTKWLYLEMKEGVIQDVRGGCSDDCLGSMAILNNVFTVGE
jgi:hypothetical protein